MSLPSSGPSMRASFNQRAVASPPENDLVPNYQSKEVLGCPGLLRWDMMTPIQWISQPGGANFWPITNLKVKSVVEEDLDTPKRDRRVELKLSSTTVLLVRIHTMARKKLYDFENETMDGTWNYMAAFISR